MPPKRSNQSTDAPSSKRRRVELTFAQKKAICQHKKDNPKLSQPALQQFVSDQFSVYVGRSTVSNILADSAKWHSTSTRQENKLWDRPSLVVDMENSFSKWE